MEKVFNILSPSSPPDPLSAQLISLNEKKKKKKKKKKEKWKMEETKTELMTREGTLVDVIFVDGNLR